MPSLIQRRNIIRPYKTPVVAPPAGGLTYKPFSVTGTESTVGTGSGNGLIRTVSSPLDNWIICAWVKNLENSGNRTLFAGTTGQEQLWEAISQDFAVRSSNVDTSTAAVGSYAADTWEHVMVKFDKTNTTRTIYSNGSSVGSQNAAAAFDSGYELDQASQSHHWLQDDGEDADCDAVFFDIIAVNLNTSLASFTPTDFNYSAASGGSWTEFTDWASWGGESYGLGGTGTNLYDDRSGNGNHFTQSGTAIVDRTSSGFTGDELPQGA